MYQTQEEYQKGYIRKTLSTKRIRIGRLQLWIATFEGEKNK
jgi:hypothetical protein